MSVEEAKQRLRRSAGLGLEVRSPAAGRAPAGEGEAAAPAHLQRRAGPPSPGRAALQLFVEQARRAPVRTAVVAVVAGVAIVAVPALRRTAIEILRKAISRSR